MTDGRFMGIKCLHVDAVIAFFVLLFIGSRLFAGDHVPKIPAIVTGHREDLHLCPFILFVTHGRDIFPVIAIVVIYGVDDDNADCAFVFNFLEGVFHVG